MKTIIRSCTKFALLALTLTGHLPCSAGQSNSTTKARLDHYSRFTFPLLTTALFGAMCFKHDPHMLFKTGMVAAGAFGAPNALYWACEKNRNKKMF